MDRDTITEIYERHAQVCQTMAEPKRLRIINELREGERSVNELAASLGLRQATVSQHLTILRHRGIVLTRREGTKIYYRLASPKIIQACDLMREVLTEQLAHSLELSRDLQP
ncbi:MAG: metalloregulator ArsR/SmtB family transcription factor [Chloroflexi bacterium]|nr:metalloregulator ArsR/SmtB family transcription factor [Chloroflexota bacterium]MCL5076312.1 metalloregulator ArsR/SmtB family transcription factor [Chloroflexota bacterium]